MKPSRPEASRGSTLIESMVSMAVLTFGMLGLISAEVSASRNNGQALKMSQATALAQRVLQSLELEGWSSPALTDADISNNADVDDAGDLFLKETLGTTADHQLNPASLLASPAAGGALTTLPGFAATDDLDYNADGAPDYEVFWNVSDCSLDANWNFACSAPPVVDVKRIGVVVRWRRNGRWYSATTQGSIFNPARLGE